MRKDPHAAELDGLLRQLAALDQRDLALRYEYAALDRQRQQLRHRIDQLRAQWAQPDAQQPTTTPPAGPSPTGAPPPAGPPLTEAPPPTTAPAATGPATTMPPAAAPPPAATAHGATRPGATLPGATPHGAAPPGAAPRPSAPWQPETGWPATGRSHRPETSTRSVQAILLVLGGILLAVAAVVFTAVAWATFGVTGRTVILVAITAIALALPVVLRQRELTATAETVAAVALLLVLLDGYAAWTVNLLGVQQLPPSGYAALVFLVTALLAAAYQPISRLNVPWVWALLALQPVLPLLAAATDTGLVGYAAAFTGTAALDFAALFLLRRAAPAAVWVLAGVLGACEDTLGGLLAAGKLILAHTEASAADAVRASVLGSLVLLAAAGLAVAAAAAAKHHVARQITGGVAAVALVVAIANTASLGFPGYGLLTAAVATMLVWTAGRLLPAGWRTGPLVACWVTAGLVALPATGAALLGGAIVLVAALDPVWHVALADWRTTVADLNLLRLGWQELLALALLSVGSLLLAPERYRRLAGHHVAVLGLCAVALGVPVGLALDWWSPIAIGLLGGAGLAISAGYAGAPSRIGVRGLGAAVLCGYAAGAGLVRPGVTAATLAGIAVIAAVTALTVALGPRATATPPAVPDPTPAAGTGAASTRAASTAAASTGAASMAAAGTGAASTDAAGTGAASTDAAAAAAAAARAVGGVAVLVAVAVLPALAGSTGAALAWPTAAVVPAMMGAASLALGIAAGLRFAGSRFLRYAVVGVSLATASATVTVIFTDQPTGVYAATSGLIGVAGGMLLLPSRREAAIGNCVAAGLPFTVALVSAVPAILSPLQAYLWVFDAWGGTGGTTRTMLAPDPVFHPGGWDPLTLALITLAAGLAGYGLAGRHRVLPAVLPGLTVTALVIPIAYDWPWPALPTVALAIAVLSGLGIALRSSRHPGDSVRAPRHPGESVHPSRHPGESVHPSRHLGDSGARHAADRPDPWGVAVVVWPVAGSIGLGNSLAGSTITVIALGIATLSGLIAGLAGRSTAARVTGWLVGGATAAMLADAAGRVLDLGDARGYAVLAVAIALLGAAAALPPWSPATGTATATAAGSVPGPAGTAPGSVGPAGAAFQSAAGPTGTAAGGAVATTAVGRVAEKRATEWLSFAVAGYAVAVAAPDLTTVAALFAGYGAILGLSALRPGRRRLLIGAAGCELVAWWLFLHSHHVGLVEAYTLPFAAGALLAGLLELRLRPGLSSWRGYGLALAAGFLPSLGVMLAGNDLWQRRLLLGLAALTVLVIGAVRHRQAPVVVGGVVLLISTLRELAGLWELLPRWIPLAAAGLLLLALGATYEQRRRDVRRLHQALSRMS